MKHLMLALRYLLQSGRSLLAIGARLPRPLKGRLSYRLFDAIIGKLRARGGAESHEVVTNLGLANRLRIRMPCVQRWSRLSEQIFRVDKWSLCRG